MLPVVNGLGLEVQYVFPNDETKKRTLSRDGHDSMNFWSNIYASKKRSGRKSRSHPLSISNQLIIQLR